tara:strand:- start:471 stop:836 length:366 start_codon:yes stop_codon:yes gene_type:complete
MPSWDDLSDNTPNKLKSIKVTTASDISFTFYDDGWDSSYAEYTQDISGPAWELARDNNLRLNDNRLAFYGLQTPGGSFINPFQNITNNDLKIFSEISDISNNRIFVVMVRFKFGSIARSSY